MGIFFLVFLATLPVALPFAFIPEAHRALRVSNGIALLMLFLGGYYLGRHGRGRPLLSGLVTARGGCVAGLGHDRAGRVRVDPRPYRPIEPDSCREYPWNVERFANSLKYLRPTLALCLGKATFTPSPIALTA